MERKIMIKYPHLHLVDWPFRIVPDENSCSFMADRTQLTNEVKTLIRGLSRQTASSMHLMWAWFGAGKTHTLKHIKYLCKKEFTKVIPIYVEFPKGIKNFLNLYKSFITALDKEVLENAYYEVATSSTKDKILKELNYDFPDLSYSLKFLYEGRPQEQDIAIRWLRAEYKEKQILRNIGIVKPIQTAEDATKVIGWIIRLINIGSSSSGVTQRVLWMLDEYQRIEGLKKPAIDEINGCLHSIFNRCPDGLSIIISFSGYPKKRLPDWLSSEIRDRLDKKHLLLPPLSKDEVLIFVRDIMKHFRSPGSNVDDYFPFNQESVKVILKKIEEEAKKKKRQDEPKPRTIMHSFNMVLREAEPLIEKGEMKTINSEFATRVLEGISLIEEES
jgi:hypothetical protein